ncbi:MAG: ATP phosphoribosyltransferase regulatory subunit, partial [Sphingomonadales bacterium]
DFTLPDLVDTLAGESAQLEALRERLDAKDAGGVAAIDATYLPLIEAAGPFDAALARLRAIDSGKLSSRLDGLEKIASAIAGQATLTLDPTERHGFEYQSWLGFSLFAHGVRGEIGRGGSYTIIHDAGTQGGAREEAAVGFSLYADPILDAGLGAGERRRLFLPFGTPSGIGATLRGEGWATVAALEADDTPEAQLCSHVLRDGAPQPL